MWELYSRLPRGQFTLAADESVGSEEFDLSHDVSIIRLPLKFNSWGAIGCHRTASYYRAYARLGKLVRARDIRSIHASNCLPEGFLAWLVYRRLGLPYIIYVHGEELNVVGNSRELTWMTRRVYRDAAMVIANSHNTARILRDAWPVSEDRLRVMHPGVDTSHFRPAPRDRDVRRRLAWDDRPVVLTVGRLTKRKGQDQLIRALPAIAEAIPDVLYAIVGNGDERQRLEQLAVETGVSDRVVFHGELATAELLAAYQQCDVFALPNRVVDGDFEGFGMVLLEAQACGKPVIAGDSGGTVEATNAPHSGRIVRQHYPEELSTAVIELLRDESLRTKMGAIGREWVQTNFDWAPLVARAAVLFSSLERESAVNTSGLPDKFQARHGRQQPMPSILSSSHD